MAQARPKQPPVTLDSRRPARGRGARPHIVPDEGPLIKQQDLQEIVARRKAVTDLTARLAEAKRLVEDAETPIFLAFSVAGTRVEPGPFVVAVEVERSRHPSWKNLFIQRCGKDAADLALANTPTKEVKSLVITETRAPVGA